MVLYLCDPDKNAVCKKSFCAHLYSDGECMATTNPECAKLDEDGKPIPYALFGVDLAAEKEDQEEKAMNKLNYPCDKTPNGLCVDCTNDGPLCDFDECKYEALTFSRRNDKRKEKSMNKIILNEESEDFKKIKQEWHKKADECKSMQDFQNLYTEIFENYEHDYGTICHAIVVMMRAAFRMCDASEQGGITGFQANCIMWEFIHSEFYRHNQLGLRMIDYDKLLYPQYEDHFKVSISQEKVDKLKEIVQERLALDIDKAHPKVVEHWEKIVKGEIPFGLPVGD